MFVQNFFWFFYWNLWVKTNKKATLTFSMDAYIFSDFCLKNHKIFIFHLLSTFRNIMKIFRKSSPKIFISGFLNSPWKIRQNHWLNFLVSIKFPYVNWWLGRAIIISKLSIKFTTLFYHRFVPFGTEFWKFLFLQKIRNTICIVLGVISFDSQDIF